MSRTKIEWTDITYNPVWGCKNNCPYCYARRLAGRFYKEIADKEIRFWYPGEENPDHEDLRKRLEYDIKSFKPTYIYSNAHQRLPVKSKKIFVGSMSDISFWEPKWIDDLAKTIRAYPQHTFQLLTKNPMVYLKYKFPKNVWLGVTITGEERKNVISRKIEMLAENKCNLRFISYEPIIGYVGFEEYIYIETHGHYSRAFDWFIAGALTGVKSKIKIDDYIEANRSTMRFYDIPYFEKGSVKKYVNRDLVQEFPGEKDYGRK